MAWAVALNPNNEGNQYISSIDIQSQSGNSNPVWNLKFKLAAGNEVSGFYRIASESIGNVSTNRILLAADLSEIRFYRGTSPKTFSLSGVSITNEFEFVSDGNNLELLVNSVSQGVISGATGALFTNIGANFGNYSNMQLEYMEFTTTDDTNLNRNYDATGSDHNSLILSDLTGNDADGGSFNNMTTANWIDLGGGGIVEDSVTNLSLSDSSVDALSLTDSSQSVLSLLDNSIDQISITESVISNIAISDLSVDALSITETDVTALSLVDNSTDNVAGGIVEDVVTNLALVNNSIDTLEITDSDVTTLTLNDSSTDILPNGIVEDAVTNLSLIDGSVDSIEITEFSIANLTLVDSSTDTVGTNDFYVMPSARVAYTAPGNRVVYTAPNNRVVIDYAS